MIDTLDLYQLAEDSGIPVFALSAPESGSFCIQTDRRCYVAMDYGILLESAAEKVHLAHELGHCCTGSFYSRWTAYDLRQKHENTADRWAISQLIPPDALADAVAAGCTELWQLAEHFGVTEAFMRKAACLYAHGNLAVDLYW